MKTKSTTTLVDSDGNPTVVTYPGHVDRKTFSKGHSLEWSSDPYSAKYWKESRRYEYYIPHKTKAWKRVDAGTRGAKPFTVLPWD